MTQRDPKNKERKKKRKKKERSPKKPNHVTCHVFAETTHVVAAPHGFACVDIPELLVRIGKTTAVDDKPELSSYIHQGTLRRQPNFCWV